METLEIRISKALAELNPQDVLESFKQLFKKLPHSVTYNEFSELYTFSFRVTKTFLAEYNIRKNFVGEYIANIEVSKVFRLVNNYGE